MQPNAAQPQTVVVTGVSNQEFLELHARPGRIGLSGGVTFIDKAICRAERHLDEREHRRSHSGRRHGRDNRHNSRHSQHYVYLIYWLLCQR